MVALTAGPGAPPRAGTGRRVLGRVAVLGGLAVLLAALVLPWRPATLCLLRAVTGVPCPFCGGTTAMVELGGGDVPAALRASPLVVLGAPLWVLWPRLQPVVAAWSRSPGRRRAGLATGAAALAASEAWQLHRYLG